MKIDPSVKEELKKFIENEAGQSKKVTIITPYVLSAAELAEIKQKFLEFKAAEMNQELDKDLLGGFIIKFGSKMINLSIQGELQKLQQRIYEIT